jgi:hypothetical protein
MSARRHASFSTQTKKLGFYLLGVDPAPLAVRVGDSFNRCPEGFGFAHHTRRGIVHWLGTRPRAMSLDPFRLVGMVEILPYQDGSTLPSDDDVSIEILTSITTTESRTHTTPSHSREIFMVR